MPRIHSITELRFVEPGYVEPHGYVTKIVDEHTAIEAYAAHFEHSLRRAQDQIQRCGELGHYHAAGGCGGFTRNTGVAQCEAWLLSLKDVVRTPERSVLVRITIPVD